MKDDDRCVFSCHLEAILKPNDIWIVGYWVDPGESYLDSRILSAEYHCHLIRIPSGNGFQMGAALLRSTNSVQQKKKMHIL